MVQAPQLCDAEGAGGSSTCNATINPLFTDENAVCMVWGDNTYTMVLTSGSNLRCFVMSMASSN
jgi:predicted lactoylglutathione lyase